MTGGARPPAPPLALSLIEDVESAFYLHLDVEDRPGVLATVTQVLGEQLVSIKSVVQRGLGEHARLVMVTHPVLESALRAAVERLDGLRLPTLHSPDDPRDRRGVHVSQAYKPVPLPRIQGGVPSGTHVPLIERYLDRLPFEASDKLVSLQEGSTPLLQAPVISAMVGAEVRLKLEGGNPTGSFKDRGMTCALSAAVRDGAKAVICASTGNTAASAAAYAARAGITCAVIVPEGKIAQGKMAQTLMHGARVISLRGQLRPGAEARARADRRAPDRARQLGQRVPDRRAEDSCVRDPRGARRRLSTRSVSRSATAATSPPTGAASARSGAAPRIFGFQAAGAAPLVEGHPIEHPETIASAIRIGNPVRWEDAMAAATDSRGSIRVVSDAEILEAYRLLAYREGMFCEPASAASVAGLLKYGAEGAEQIVCVLTGRGLKDPETAIANNDGRMITADVEIGAIEEAVLGDP